MINMPNLIDDAKCFEMVRQLHWPNGVRCPSCDATDSAKRGVHTQQPARHRYVCRACARQFDDLTGTVFEGHHQPVTVWMLCLYLMGLNLSNQQIAAELDLNESDTQVMTMHLREGVVAKKSPSP